MFIYSVTIHIQKEEEAAWLKYMQQKHLADVLNTGCFIKASMRKTVENSDTKSSTYNMEYYVETLAEYDTYVQQAAPALQKEVLDKFAGKFTAERKLLEIITEL